MKRPSLQKKRRPAKGGMFIFHSKTRRRKQRVAAGAAADLGSEVPNLGVARALFVILVLHVAAIAAIIVHNKVTNDDPVVRKSAVQSEGAKPVTSRPEALGTVQPGEGIYFVTTGDTYDKISKKTGVAAADLRVLNNDVPLAAGTILRVPGRGAPPSGSGAAVAAVDQPAREERPPVQPQPAPVEPEVVAIDPVEPEPSQSAPEVAAVEDASPVVVTPQRNPNVIEGAPAAVPVAEPGKKYTVRSGDSVWRIARRFSVPQDQLLKVNGISDPRKLRVGMTLDIPTAQ